MVNWTLGRAKPLTRLDETAQMGYSVSGSNISTYSVPPVKDEVICTQKWVITTIAWEAVAPFLHVLAHMLVLEALAILCGFSIWMLKISSNFLFPKNKNNNCCILALTISNKNNTKEIQIFITFAWCILLNPNKWNYKVVIIIASSLKRRKLSFREVKQLVRHHRVWT